MSGPGGLPRPARMAVDAVGPILLDQASAEDGGVVGGVTGGSPPERLSPRRRATARAMPPISSTVRISGSQTIPKTIRKLDHGLAHRDQRRGRLVDLRGRIPLRGRLGHGHDLGPERHGQGRHRRLVGQLGLLRGQLLDLAPGVGQPALDLEEIGDLRRLLGIGDERRLAGLQVPDPGIEVDDLAGDLDGVGLLADLGPEAADRRERVLPARDRDAIRDRGDDRVAVALLLRRADVAADVPDRVSGVRERARDVRDGQLERAGPDDLRVLEDRDLVARVAGPRAGPAAGPRGGAVAVAGRGLLSGAVVRGSGRRGGRGRRRAPPTNGADADDPQATTTAPTATRTRRTVADGCGRRREVGLRIARSSMCGPSGAAAQASRRQPAGAAVPPPTLDRCICRSTRPSSRCWPRRRDGLPDGDGWLYEPKWDGFRAIVFRDGDEVLHPEPRPEAARPLLPGARRAAPRGAPRALRRRRRGRDRPARRARLRGAAAADPPGGVAGEDARRGDAGELRRRGTCSRSATRTSGRRPRPSGAPGSRRRFASVEPPIHLTPATRDRVARRRLVRPVRGRRPRRRRREAARRAVPARASGRC